MTKAHPLLTTIDATVARATESGTLQPIRTERTHVRDGGIDFTVRWVSSLARKDAARVEVAIRRDPDFNPFLPPEPELTVGALGDRHLAVLNKFPVIDRHLLLVTRDYVAQTAPLDLADFTALADVMLSLGGLGFYNGGTEAGASQRHKHLQWVPDTADGASLAPFVASLPGDAPFGRAFALDALPWLHAFVRVDTSKNEPVIRARALLEAFNTACRALHIDAASDPMSPYNLLVSGEWLVVIPRSHEHHANISVNALGFGTSLFVRRPDEIDTVREIGPLNLLAAVARRTMSGGNR